MIDSRENIESHSALIDKNQFTGQFLLGTCLSTDREGIEGVTACGPHSSVPTSRVVHQKQVVGFPK